MRNIIKKIFGRLTEEKELFYDNKRKMHFDYSSPRESILFLFFIISLGTFAGMAVAVISGGLAFDFTIFNYFVILLITALFSGFLLSYTDDFYFVDLQEKTFCLSKTFFKKRNIKKLFALDQVIGIAVSGNAYRRKKQPLAWEYKIIIYSKSGHKILLKNGFENFAATNETGQVYAESMGVPFFMGIKNHMTFLNKNSVHGKKIAYKKPNIIDNWLSSFGIF